MEYSRMTRSFALSFVGMILWTGFLFFPSSVSAENGNQTIKMEQDGRGGFASLFELTADGKTLPIPTRAFRTAIAKNSRLWIRFKKDLMRKSILFDEKDKDWETLKKEFIAKGISDELETEKSRQFLLESEGYEVSVAARIIPKSSMEFDLPVEGFTTVTRAAGKEDETSVTTTMERRLYRVDIDAETDKLKLVDSLPDTVIPLPEAKVSDGDRLVVAITNHHGISPQSAVWELEIKDIGLFTKQDATLLLVKRLGAAGDKDDLENNFKPAPGSSFLFKYRSRNKLWNFIDPAVGVNGSFLDFRSDKDLEIGVGIVISFFNGLVQLNYGWNLHVKNDRQYWSIGLGFLDIAGKIKEFKKE